MGMNMKRVIFFENLTKHCEEFQLKKKTDLMFKLN